MYSEMKTAQINWGSKTNGLREVEWSRKGTNFRRYYRHTHVKRKERGYLRFNVLMGLKRKASYELKSYC